MQDTASAPIDPISADLFNLDIQFSLGIPATNRKKAFKKNMVNGCQVNDRVGLTAMKVALAVEWTRNSRAPCLQDDDNFEFIL